MSEVASIIDGLARVLAWCAVPILAFAVVASFVHRGRGPLLSGRSVRSVLVPVVGCAFVVSVTVVGVLAGQQSGSAWAVPWGGVPAFVLVALLIRRDERFWAGLSALVVVYGLVGAVSVLGFSHSYDAGSGGWRGARLLVAWAGPEANPQAPNFALAVTHLSIVHYGIPLALTVATSWVLATRRGMSRLERGGLLLLVGALLAEVAVSSTLSSVAFAVGVIASLPLGLGLVGLLANLVMLVTVGPGAVTGIVVGVRRLAKTRDTSAAPATGGLVTRLWDAGGAQGSGVTDVDGAAAPVSLSLVGFLRGQITWVRRFNIVVVVGALVVVGGLSFTYRAFLDDPNRVEVTYQYVDSEQPVEGRVQRAVDGAQQTLWLVTRDHRLLHFDPSTQQLKGVDLSVLDALPLGDRVVTITAEPTPRVVLVGGLDGGKPVTLTPVLTLARGSNPTLAVVGDTAFVAERGGRVVAVSSKGTVVRQANVGALTAVLGEPPGGKRPGVLWTLQPATAAEASEGATHRAVRRNLATLAATGTETVTGTDILRWLSGLTYDTTTGAFSPRPGDGPRRWQPGAGGRIDLDAAGKRTRYDFHYDAVVAVRETSRGTWLVVDDSTGVALTPRSQPASYLVHWPGAPEPAALPAAKPKPTPKPAAAPTPATKP